MDNSRDDLVERNRKAIRNFWRERYNRDRLITACANLDEYIACKGQRYNLVPFLREYYWDGFCWQRDMRYWED